MTAPPPPGAGISEHACARAWAALTAAHARVASQLTAALQRECGLTITDFEILLRLDAGHGAGQRIGDLTGPIRLSQPALSRAVARLAGRGFLTRSGSPADVRCVHASVINEALLGRISPAEQEVLARVLARVADG